MGLRPTHRKRTPYLLHFEGQTVVLGESEYLFAVNEYLLAAQVATRPTLWDQAYLEAHADWDPQALGVDLSLLEAAGGPDARRLLNSVGCNLEMEDFWEALERGVFASAPWHREATVFVPQLPDWLVACRSWFFDPVAPAEGPGSAGGWSRVRSRPGSGYPVGLFQLTSRDTFWVLGGAEELEAIFALCQGLAAYRTGFDQATAYYAQDGFYSSLLLPLDCRQTLEEELFLAGLDTETLFWE